MERRISLQVSLNFGPRALRSCLTGAMLLLAAGDLGSENVTLTTYYPAPSGVYTQMITTGKTILARDVSASSFVGIGTAAPAYKLDVNGVSQFNNAVRGPYGLTPQYANWASYGTGDGGAAIYNSNEAVYRALMIVGNNSAGGARVVKVWDVLSVQGDLSVAGNATVAGTLTVGNLNLGCYAKNFGLTGLVQCNSPATERAIAFDSSSSFYGNQFLATDGSYYSYYIGTSGFMVCCRIHE